MDIWQLTVLRSILNKDCWESFRDIITPDVFTNHTTKLLHKHIAALHQQIDHDLSVDDLRLILHSTYQREDGKKAELDPLVDALDGMDPKEPKELRVYVQEFVSRELALKAVQYVASRIDSDDFDLENAANLLERATDLRHVIDADVIDYTKSGLPGEIDERPVLTSLGVSSKLDHVLCGGVAAGELLIYLAPPSRGKTSFLWATAAAAAQQGRRVLGITLELSEQKCIRRVDQWLSHYTKEELILNPRTVGLLRKEMENQDGKLWIKDWSYTRITVEDIKALILRMKQRNETVDFVVIDYLELLSPVQQNRFAERFNWSQTCKDLRALSVELQVPIVTAWQVKRDGSDKQSITAKDVSECWDVVKHADIILGLNQNELEHAEKMLRVGIIKQRESTARPEVIVQCDLDRMLIRDSEGEINGTAGTVEVDMRRRSRLYGDGAGTSGDVSPRI